MWLNHKVIKKWQPRHFFIKPIFSGLYPLSNKTFCPPQHLCKLWPPDLWPWTHLYFKKAQIEQKVIIVFIENWKEIGPWFWMIWIARWVGLFPELITLSDFGHLQGLNWGQSLIKNSDFGHVLHSVLHGIRTLKYWPHLLNLPDPL